MHARHTRAHRYDRQTRSQDITPRQISIICQQCVPKFIFLLVCSEVSSESIDSKEGPYAVDIIEEGCSQHSNKYAGGMRLVSAFRGGGGDGILTEACGVTGESEFNWELSEHTGILVARIVWTNSIENWVTTQRREGRNIVFFIEIFMQNQEESFRMPLKKGILKTRCVSEAKNKMDGIYFLE